MADVMKKIGLETGIEGKKVVVQGLGNVGFFCARFFREHGATIIAIAEYEGAIYKADGIPQIARTLSYR